MAHIYLVCGLNSTGKTSYILEQNTTTDRNTFHQHLLPIEIYRRLTGDLKLKFVAEWISKINGEDSNSVYKYLKDFTLSNLCREGTGFLQVITIAIKAWELQSNDYFYLNYPENFIHPQWQNRLIKNLIDLTISKDLNLYLESNSVHILNALRIAIKYGYLNRDDLSILYFQLPPEEKITKIEVDYNGRISNWLDGFFDQIDIDHDKLFEPSKS